MLILLHLQPSSCSALGRLYPVTKILHVSIREHNAYVDVNNTIKIIALMLEDLVKYRYENKITKKVGEMKILNKISASVVALAAVSGVFGADTGTCGRRSLSLDGRCGRQ